MNTACPEPRPNINPEQARLRRELAAQKAVVGVPTESPATVMTRFEGFLAELEASYAEAGATPPPPVVYKREWRSKVSSQILAWELKSCGGEVYEGLQVEVQRFHFNRVQCTPSCTYAEMKFNGEPDYVMLTFATQVATGRRVLHAQANVVTDVSDGRIPALKVEIEWNAIAGKRVPHCRARHRDNINIIFVDPDGCHVVMLEVSVTSRHGHFWVCIQELGGQQIARTTTAKAARLGLKTLPLDHGFAGLGVPVYPENCFPGADSLLNFRDQMPGVIRYCADEGFIVPLSKCHRPPEWNPGPAPTLDAKMVSNGWQVATVLWFNVPIGFGFARLPDGRNVFCHFKALVDDTGRDLASKGEFPLLEPMQHVALKHQPGDKGGLKATAIRLLK